MTDDRMLGWMASRDRLVTHGRVRHGREQPLADRVPRRAFPTTIAMARLGLCAHQPAQTYSPPG